MTVSAQFQTPTNLLRLILERPLLALSFALALIAVSAIGLQFLTFDPDDRVFFDDDDPGIIALDKLEATFSPATSVLYVVAPKDGNVFSPEAIAAIADLTETGWTLPLAQRVDSLTNYQHSYAEGDDVMVEDLIPAPTALSDEDINRVRTIALSEPELVGRMVSENGAVTAVAVTLNNSGEAKDTVELIVTEARAAADAFREKYPGIDLYLTGGAPADYAFADAAQRDMGLLVPIMAIVVIIVLVLSVGSVAGTVATFAVIGSSVVFAMGLAGWSGLTLNSASVGAPVIIMTLALADCVHILASFVRGLEAAKEKLQAIRDAITENALPILITSLTTAIGFLSLNFSNSPPLRDFGNAVAIGMVAALIFSLTLFPALIILMPFDRWPSPLFRLLSRLLPQVGQMVNTRRVALLVAWPVLVIVAVTGLSRLTIEDSFVHYFDKRFEFRVHTDFAEEHLRGLRDLRFLLPAGEESGIADPDYLRKVDAFVTWYEEQPHVVGVSSITKTLKRLNKNMHGDADEEYKLPESRDLAAQYLLFYEMSLPFGRDLNETIDISKSASLVKIELRDVTSREIIELVEAGEAWLQENAPEMATPAAGMSVLYGRLTERNIRSMILGTGAALILISFCLLFVFKDLRLGLLSLVPNLFPALIAFGAWGYLVGQVNMAVSAVAAVTLGVVVDDTVHLLTRYIRARRHLNEPPEQAVRTAINSAGMAIVLTTIALLLGFGVLATSGFAVLSQLGQMSAMMVLLALIIDLIFLPPLLLTFDRRLT